MIKNIISLDNRTTVAVVLFIIIFSSIFIKFSYIQLNLVPSGDEGQYMDVAKSVYESRGYYEEVLDVDHPTGREPAVGIMPLYIYSIVLIHKLAGYSERNAYYVNLVFAGLLLLLCFGVTKKLFDSTGIALLSTGFIAFDPVLTRMTALATKDI